MHIGPRVQDVLNLSLMRAADSEAVVTKVPLDLSDSSSEEAFYSELADAEAQAPSSIGVKALLDRQASYQLAIDGEFVVTMVVSYRQQHAQDGHIHWWNHDMPPCSSVSFTQRLCMRACRPNRRLTWLT